MDDDYLVCDDDRCVLTAEDFQEDGKGDPHADRFNKVLADVARVYANAILVGAVAAAKYIRHPVEPRKTHDVDVLLDEKDFAEFLLDDIPQETLTRLESYFDTSDSANHSMKHRETGVYVDFLSSQSKPIRKKIIRHVLDNREASTHVLLNRGHTIDILKPEYLLAMKVNRYAKNPKTERGLSDRVDIVKILKTLREKKTPIDHDLVKSFLNRSETKIYDALLGDARLQTHHAST